MSLDLITIWNRCLEIIKDNVKEENYSTWFVPIVPLKYENNSITLKVPTHFVYEQLEANYSDLIGKTLVKVTGKKTRLLYSVETIKNESVNIEGSTIEGVSNNNKVRASSPFDEIATPDFESQINPNLNFSSFVGGKSNVLARTAGYSISENPGHNIFNPLFLHGKSGVGKTHLLHAIGNEALRLNSNLRVLYISSNLFQVQYTQAYLTGKINDFVHFYQSIDILMVDDIHELSHKTGTQNVFFNIFNHLHQNGKQIIMTCDRSPKDLQDIEERLITRFKWGLTAEMQLPDYKLRIAILKSKIAHEGLDFPEEVIDYIAKNATESVRDLEGIVVSMMAHSLIEHSDINLDLAKSVVLNTVNIEDHTLTIGHIEKEVSKYFNIDIELLHSKSKKKEISQARQITMYLARKLTENSFSTIGEKIGNRNHATVLHACNNVSNWIETNKKFAYTIKDIETTLDCR